jgi:Tfp pilus assembly protein PilF
VTVSGHRTTVACLGGLLCGLAACAGLSDRRAQDADAHFRMATAALQQAGGIQSEVNRRAAYPELTLAIKLDPKNARYHQTLGTMYLYNQDYQSAERENLLALRLDPGYAEGHNNLGLVYLSQGRLSEAAAQFRKALENLSYPTPEYAAYNLGKAAFLLKDFAVAAEAYERSLAILPNNPEGRFELGMSYTQLGRLADAEKAFTAALLLRPDAARTRYELGMVLFKLGRREEAVLQFRRVVELDPAGDLGEQSRTYLKLLK